MRPTKQTYLNQLYKSSKTGVFPGYENGACEYLTASGHRCGIGVLIPDRPETKEILSYSGHVHDLVRDHPEVREYFPEDMSNEDLFLVQTAHDDVAQDLGGNDWHHEKFMKRILALECFKGMTPEEQS